MTFCLREYDRKNTFFAKLYTNYGGKSKLSISLDQMLCSFLVLYVQVEVYQNILEL